MPDCRQWTRDSERAHRRDLSAVFYDKTRTWHGAGPCAVEEYRGAASGQDTAANQCASRKERDCLQNLPSSFRPRFFPWMTSLFNRTSSGPVAMAGGYNSSLPKSGKTFACAGWFIYSWPHLLKLHFLLLHCNRRPSLLLQRGSL